MALDPHSASASALVPLGWLDGFSDSALESGGHHCVPIAGLYGLVWPAEHQGGLKATAQRLMAAGHYGAVLPARYGQRVQSAVSLRGLLRAQSAALRQSLRSLGRQHQYTIILPFEAPACAESAADLRAKHAARVVSQQALNDKLQCLAPFLSNIQGAIGAQLPPTAMAGDKVGVHLCISQNAEAVILANWQRYGPKQALAALVGPLPPYAFAQHRFDGPPDGCAA